MRKLSKYVQFKEDSPMGYGKDYRLNELPDWAKPALIADDWPLSHYNRYNDWLADYLFQHSPEPNDRQQKLVEELKKNKRSATIGLAISAVNYDLYILDEYTHSALAELQELANYNNYNEDDIEWIYNHARYLAEKNVLREQDCWMEDGIIVDERNPYILELSPLENIRQYLTERAELRDLWENPEYELRDSGWRIPLARILEDIEDKDERIELIELFYDQYNDDWYK